MLENLELTHGALFSQRVLLALVEAGCERDDAYRIVQELAQRAWDEGIPLRELLDADERAAGLDLDAIFDFGHYIRHAGEIVSPARRDRLSAAPLRPTALVASRHVTQPRRPAPDRQREGPRDVRAGRRSERRRSRLLMVASDRISTYDAVHPTPIPDKGRVLTGLSVFWFEKTGHIVANHLISATEGVPEEARGRALVVRAPADAAGRVRRARLHHRLGLEGLPGDRHRRRASSCRPGCGSQSSCPSRSSRPPRRPRRATTRRSTSSAPRSSSATAS